MISEHDRYQLYTKLEEVLGGQEAGTLMGYLPPVGWADVATKDDLRSLEARLGSRMTGLESRMEGLESRIGALDDRFQSKLEALESGLEAKLAVGLGDVRGQMRSLFLSLVGLQMTAAALAVGLARVL